MRHLIAWLVAICIPALVHALPAEDHWTVEMDGPTAAAFQQGADLVGQEKFKEALPILEGLALDLPANADVFNLLGFAHRKVGNLPEAEKNYERALFLDPNHLGALEYQGELFLMLGDLDQAQANLERLKLLCSSPCEERDELEEAVRSWQKN